MQAAFVSFLCVVYFVLNIPLIWHTDVWGHLAYGRQITAAKSLPTTEPLMALSEGVRFLDTAWLTQVAAFAAYEQFGVLSLTFMYSVSITACIGLLVWRVYKRTESVFFSLLAFGAFTAVNWMQLAIIRPQLAGMLCFMALFVLLTSKQIGWFQWLGVPIVFALWANMHGSFPAGILLLACFFFGRAIDVFRKTRKPFAFLKDGQTWRYFALLELGIFAALINPYGFGIYPEVLGFAAQGNLGDLFEWGPLNLRMIQGRWAAVAAMALIVAYRYTPRRVSATELLMLVGLGAMALWTSRMILWWAPVAAFWLAIHGAAALNRRRRRIQDLTAMLGDDESAQPNRSGLMTVVVLGVIWISFGFSKFGYRVIHNKQPEFERVVSQYTPVGAVEYLKKNPPVGQVFNTYEWGDYLMWAGPKDMKVFVASHVQYIPAEVWNHYIRVINLSDGYSDILDKYSVNTMVLDSRRRSRLIAKMKRADGWYLRYEDGRSAIFTRVKPIL